MISFRRPIRWLSLHFHDHSRAWQHDFNTTVKHIDAPVRSTIRRPDGPVAAGEADVMGPWLCSSGAELRFWLVMPRVGVGGSW